MKLHEYQAKQLFDRAGIPVPFGLNAKTPEEAAHAFETVRQMCPPAPAPFVANVKAQLHAGGRGKVGGVVAVRSAQEAATEAARLLGKRLVTQQTGPEGLPVSSVLVDERSTLEKEWYLALTIDRFSARPIILASRLGGIDIEEVAGSEPSAILREPVDLESGLGDAACARIAQAFQSSEQQAGVVGRIARAMWRVFLLHDASLIEINPLGALKDGRIVAVDAKVTLDDNALFRHPELSRLRDESQEHLLELKASRIGISYVGLDGNIGCLVNGAGLAMATNDIIQLSGGMPANFLDVGGGANVEQVTNAFAIILSDARVKAILVNIFGGIMRCDWIAEGLLQATEQLEVKVPIVVRLQGTNVEEGRRLLGEAKRLNLISVDELADAARKVVELAK